MSTEVVFTAPHKDRVEGVVYGTKPYVFNGQLIKNFRVTFEKGRVVDYHAEQGQVLLEIGRASCRERVSSTV